MKEIPPPSRTYYEHKLGSPEKAQHFPNKNCRTRTKKTGKLSNLKFTRTEVLLSFQTPQRMKERTPRHGLVARSCQGQEQLPQTRRGLRWHRFLSGNTGGPETKPQHSRGKFRPAKLKAIRATRDKKATSHVPFLRKIPENGREQKEAWLKTRKYGLWEIVDPT